MLANRATTVCLFQKTVISKSLQRKFALLQRKQSLRHGWGQSIGFQ